MFPFLEYADNRMVAVCFSKPIPLFLSWATRGRVGEVESDFTLIPTIVIASSVVFQGVGAG